jgi:hypothetical protein
MKSELARTAAGLPVAAIWPLTLPYLSRSRARATAVAAASTIYILAPQLFSLTSLVLAVITIATAHCIWRSPGDEDLAGSGPRLLTRTSIAATLLAVAAAALLDFGAMRGAVEQAVQSNRVALVATGLIACVFIGGALIAWILQPFTKVVKDQESTPDFHSLKHAGRYIGWFERALLFAFIVGGEPQAAAVAFAAKSFARFPSLSAHDEGFAEYFLIGSLASLTTALILAIGTRGAIGLSPIL